MTRRARLAVPERISRSVMRLATLRAHGAAAGPTGRVVRVCRHMDHTPETVEDSQFMPFEAPACSCSPPRHTSALNRAIHAA